MMVGRELNTLYPEVPAREVGPILLRAEKLSRDSAVREVSLELRAGEIVGLYGLMGAGRTELVRLLFGVDKRDSGKLTVKGKEILVSDPRKCIERGMAFITEDRRDEGLLMPKSVKDNLVFVKLDQLAGLFSVINRKKENSESQRMIDALKIRVANFFGQAVNSLSGGNQQKVVFGKWLLNDPTIFIMDEPTRGVDVGAKYEIYKIIAELAVKGASILMVSSEMEELIGICDRIMVMKKGGISGEVARSDFHQETIANLAF